ncbi:uncharacterized protein DC041_0003466 [Schistosoma bovis]|uniref:Metallo-beta-lactamase domain-containing protein 1 n=1 Tax=Schistosoma bovis TaxID=6184 RepID=A0A430QAR6_SCHBO|nr:uncharacterized protein DC041_0003466 [Schistosoma bovis]
MGTDGYSVFVLHEGHYARSPDYVYRKCNTALIRGPAGAYVVNPGSVWNGPELLSSLKAAGIHEPEKDIKGVICTDGHAEHVGCMSTFGCAEIMIVGYDIQMRGDKFLEHDFSCGITPYEFDENFCVIGTPGQRGPQVSLIVNGRLIELKTGECRESCRIAVTGNLFMDVQDASRVSFLDTLEGNYGESNCDKENLINGWRQSRMSILERADWVVPAYGPPFKANRLRQHFTHQFSCSLKKPIPNLYSRYLYQYKLKKQNKLLTAAAIDACNLKPGDDVLEIGFGQGYGIRLAAECVAPVTMNHWKSSRIKFILENAFSTSTIKSNTFKNDGHVYGVEISEYMLQKAKRKLWPLTKTDCIDLQLRSVYHLHYPPSSINACFHVNCFYFWPSLTCCLQKIWRVLRPNGRLVTTFQINQLIDLHQRGWFQYGNPDPLIYVMALETCGFNQIEWLKQQTKFNLNETYDCIIAHKPPIPLLSASIS